jgi:hypothetical protein
MCIRCRGNAFMEPLQANVYSLFLMEVLMLICLYVTRETGRAIAQAVSRWLPTAAARVQTRVWSCGIL